MNIFELSWFAMFAIAGYFAGKLLSAYLGGYGWGLGFIFGFAGSWLLQHLVIERLLLPLIARAMKSSGRGP